MGFSIQCSNKGCRQFQEPRLDLNPGSETYNEVLCAECGLPIDNVTQFHKTAMRSMGQVRRLDNSKQAYAVICPKCEKGDRPILGEGDVLLCKHCGAEHDQLSKPFVHTLLGVLKSSK